MASVVGLISPISPCVRSEPEVAAGACRDPPWRQIINAGDDEFGDGMGGGVNLTDLVTECLGDLGSHKEKASALAWPGLLSVCLLSFFTGARTDPLLSKDPRF